MDILILIISLILLFKRKLAWVLFAIILLTNDYLGAGTNLSEFPIIHNVSDAGLILYLILFFYLLIKHNFKLKETPISKYVIIFYIFLLTSIFVDLIFNGINLISIVKTSRHWIFLSSVWIFYYIPTVEVKKLIKYLLNALAIISIIMLIEFFFDLQILAREVKTEYLNPGFLITRGSIPSIFIIFFLLLLFTGYFKFTKFIKYFYISVFSAVLITSMIRSWIVAIIIGIFLIVNFQAKLKIKKVLTGIIIAAGLILIIYTNPIINERFRMGFDEMQNFTLEGNVQGNFSFRIFQAAERLNYISQSLQYEIFGVGNITEQNFPYIFKTGLRNESGIVTQLDTADIAWSLLFLRLGFLGTFIYLIFYVIMLFKLYKLKFSNPLGITTFVYLFINLTVISFASSNIATGQFWIFPVLIYYTINKN